MTNDRLMPSDPTPAPAPEWARKMADTCTGMTYDFIARLLASVRDAALREAAVEADALAAVAPTNQFELAYNRGAVDAKSAILALVGTAPKEAT